MMTDDDKHYGKQCPAKNRKLRELIIDRLITKTKASQQLPSLDREMFDELLKIAPIVAHVRIENISKL